MTRNRLANLNCDWLELCDVLRVAVRSSALQAFIQPVQRVSDAVKRANVKVKKYGARLSDSQRNCNYVTAFVCLFVYVCVCLCCKLFQV